MYHPYIGSCSSAALLSLQLARYTKEGFLHLGALGTTTLLPDTRCLVDNSKSRLPQLLDCDKVKSSLYKRWNFIQVSASWTGLAPLEPVRILQASGLFGFPKGTQQSAPKVSQPWTRGMDSKNIWGEPMRAFLWEIAFQISIAALGWVESDKSWEGSVKVIFLKSAKYLQPVRLGISLEISYSDTIPHQCSSPGSASQIW